MSVLIRRNTQIPVRREGGYITAYDNQESIRVGVNEGERPNVKHNYFLGEFSLKGLPRGPRGDAGITETFEIDANGILKVSAEHKTSGIKDEMIMTTESGRLKDDEIAIMIAEAEKLKIEDRLWKETAETRNALDPCIYDMRKRLNKEKRKGKMKKKRC